MPSLLHAAQDSAGRDRQAVRGLLVLHARSQLGLCSWAITEDLNRQVGAALVCCKDAANLLHIAGAGKRQHEQDAGFLRIEVVAPDHAGLVEIAA